MDKNELLKQITIKENELNSLQAQHTNDTPRMIELKQEVKELKEEYQNQFGSLPNESNKNPTDWKFIGVMGFIIVVVLVGIVYTIYKLTQNKKEKNYD